MTDFNQHEFANRLSVLRKANGYTQEQIAELLDIVPTTYSNYELANRLPKIDKIVKLANLLNTTTDYLLIGKEAAPIPLSNLMEKTDQILAIVSNLSVS